MKTVAFLGALLIGSAAIAQTTPTPPAPDASTMQPGTPTAPTPPADGMTPPPPPAPPADGMAPPPPPPPPAPMPMAGQPMGAPGATGQVQFAPPQATPAPAPKDSYPVCSRTVRDSCRNPGGK